jgi:hypothetical protein
MKMNKILMLGTIACLGLSSCMNEDFPSSSSVQGSISLNVDYLVPSTTRAVDTKDFPVAVYAVEGNKVFAEYEYASQVPAEITMPVGSYFATAHTPGNMDKIMSNPYYQGVDTFEILKDIKTISTVVCRMANGSFTVRYSQDFSTAFSDWQVTIDDGSESALIYTKEKDGLNPPTMYMDFAKGVKELTFNFVGTTVDGNRITSANKLTKKQASEKYDSDSEFFSGGDAIVIDLKPAESMEGKVTGVEVKANISFEETEENFEMEVEDKVTEDDTPGEGGGEDTPDTPGDGGDPNAIVLTLPSDMVVGPDTDPALGDTHIEAVNGIKSVSVKVTSTSEDMMGALVELGGAYEGIDFENGTEVVGSEGLVALFSDLGQELSVPAEGDKEYVFPIGNFFPFLVILPGDHTFILTVTDMNGNTKDGQLTLTIE